VGERGKGRKSVNLKKRGERNSQDSEKIRHFIRDRTGDIKPHIDKRDEAEIWRWGEKTDTRSNRERGSNLFSRWKKQKITHQAKRRQSGMRRGETSPPWGGERKKY